MPDQLLCVYSSGMSAVHSILIVDDDALTREVLRAVLEADSWIVHEAADGAAALAWLCGNPAPSMILCDLNMPGETGAPLANAIRKALRPGADPLVAAMTGTGLDAAPEGYETFLVKPFDPRELRSYLQARHRRRVQLRTANGEAVRELEKARTEFEPIDHEVKQRLCQSMGTEQFATLLKFGLSDARERLIRMQTCADNGDDAGFRQQAHALKGGCAMVGARRLWAMAAVAEAQGIATGYRSEFPSEIRLDDFCDEIDRLEHMLVELRAPEPVLRSAVGQRT